MAYQQVFLFFLAALSAPCDADFSVFPSIQFKPWNETSTCDRDTRVYLQNLRNYTEWATRMWDASAKQPVGWISGDVAQLGNFDECMSTSAPMPIHYCLSQLHLTLPEVPVQDDSVWSNLQNSRGDKAQYSRTPVWIGTCLPTSCRPGINSSEGVDWNLVSAEPFCTPVVEETSLNVGLILFVVISAVIALLTIIVSFLDIYVETYQDYRLVKWVSLTHSYKQLVAPSKPDHFLSIAHGLKVLSLLIVYNGHRNAIPFTFSAFYQESYENNLRAPFFGLAAQLDLSVDTFFFLSGILLSNSARSVNVLTYIIARLIRLWPIYLWVILFEANVMQHLASGPLWNLVQGSESQHCAQNWWLNALFLQNYIKNDEMCLAHTWYVPSEFHFYLLGILLLCLIKWNGRVGTAAVALTTLAAVVTPAIIQYSNGYDPVLIFYRPDFITNPLKNSAFLDIYTKSHNRATPYILGFISGLFFKTCDQNEKKRRMKRSALYVVLSVLCFMLALAYGMRFYDDTQVTLKLEAVVFTLLRRPLWAAGLFLLLLAHKEYPLRMYRTNSQFKVALLLALIGAALSCRGATVLSRLSYSFYLLHFPIIVANMAKMRVPGLFNYYDGIFSGEMPLCFIISALLFLFFDQPVRGVLNGLILRLPSNSRVKQQLSSRTPDSA